MREAKRAKEFADFLRELAATIERTGVGLVTYGHFAVFRMADGTTSRITGAHVGSVSPEEYARHAASIVDQAERQRVA